jgi:hypothetical protein
VEWRWQSAVSVLVFCCAREFLMMGDAWRDGEFGRAGSCEGRYSAKRRMGAKGWRWNLRYTV